MRSRKHVRSLSPFLLRIVLGLLFASTSPAERLPIKIYTSADGLGSSASFNLVRDSRGFIWLCSRDGLVRFDGYRFITYRVGDEEADPAVYDLTPSASGRYWVNLNRGQDYRFTVTSEEGLAFPLSSEFGSGDSRVPIPTEPLVDSPIPLLEDRDGNVWTGNDRGIYLMSETDGKTKVDPVPLHVPGKPTPAFTALVFKDARNGGVWIGTDWGLVRRFTDGRMFHFSVKPEGNVDLVRYYDEDTNGRIWIARANRVIVLKAASGTGMSDLKATVTRGTVTDDGMPSLPEDLGHAVEFSFEQILRRYTSDELKTTDLPKPEIYRVLAGRDGKIWMATNHGLVLFDGKRFQHYTAKQGLAANVISSIVEGNEGHIWLASYGGLHRLNPKGLTTYDDTDGLELARINSMYESKDGELQVVSGNFNISALRGNSFTMSHPSLPADEIHLWQSNAAFLDSRGDWWINTNENLYRFSGVKKIEDLDGRQPTQVYNESTGLLAGNILRVFEDSGGNMWLSTFVNTPKLGITRIDGGTGEIRNFQTEDGLPNAPSATAFAEDANGVLWFGFNSGGIRRYRNGRFETLDEETAPKAGVIDMFVDSKGRLWTASAIEGLGRVDDPLAEHPKFVNYSIADGLASNNVRCITEDLFGNIYVGTVRGVNRLNPETGQVKYYGTSDGLASDFINVARRDRTGAIWFGTLNGLSKLVPEPDEQARPAPVMISGLNVAGQDYSISPLGQREVFLPDQEAGRNNMRIDFLSVSSGGNAETKYQYLLADIDSNWSAPTEEHTVTLANLGPGTHRFLVRSLIGGTVSNAEPAVIHFTVLRPIWQRWWFLLIVAIVIATVVYLVYRYRLAQLLKLERVRTRIATDLHDDIGSSLSQIAILSEVARHKAGDNGAAEPLRRIADTSRDLVDSMSDIVWAINPQKDHLSDLVQRMRRFAGDTFDATDVGYRFRFDETSRDIALGADQRREIYLIFKECVNNTAKHSGAETVDIALTIDGECVRTEVNDTGRGFDVAEAMSGEVKGYGGNGLLNMRRRVERLGGEFEMESEIGKGTRVVFSIPTSTSRVKRRKVESEN